MATPTTGQRSTPNGTGSSTTNNSGPSAARVRDWGRNGEPGSAFRGLSKGRGGGERGGRGGGRGTRGGRGIGGPRGGRGQGDHANDTGTKPEISTTNTEPSTTSKSTAQKPTSSANVEKPSAPPPTSDRPSKPKASSRRASRTVPSLVIAPSSPIAVPTNNGPNTPSRPPNRRRRSQQHNKPTTPSSAASRQSSSVEPSTSHLRLPQKARTGPPSPVAPGPSKDAPPHLSAAPDIPSFDMKSNIDALVERMRAGANRPTTPGSHIDWAGDDDETLPDLDDWGVTTGTSNGDKDDMISPILEDALRPLPDLREKHAEQSPDAKGPAESSSIAESENASLAAPLDEASKSIVEKQDTYNATPPRPAESKTNEAPKERIDGGLEGSCSVPKTGLEAPSSDERKTEKTDTVVQAASNPSEASRPLHPSLPQKPAVTVDLPRARKGATPMRDPTPASIPTKPPAATEPSSVTTEPILMKPDPEPQLTDAPSQPTNATDPVPKDEPSKSEEPADKHADGEQGLAASIHAPRESVPKSTSAPSYLATPTHPRTFNPTHNRAHTLGRPQTFSQPSVPGNHFNQRFSRSGASTPRGSFAPHHARTHSSPPTGPPVMGHRAPHGTRPVITGDAISRLARTIGGTGLSSSRSAGVVSKD